MHFVHYGMAAAAAESSYSSFNTTSLSCAGRSALLNGEREAIACETRNRPGSIPERHAADRPLLLLDDSTNDRHFSDLMEKVMREAGLDWNPSDGGVTQAQLESYSVPSSPQKALRRLAVSRSEVENDAFCSSNTTLTSEDASPEFSKKEIPSVTVGHGGVAADTSEADFEFYSHKSQEPTGSQFYHGSLTANQHSNHQQPHMYIPSATPSQHQIWKEKKSKRRFGKLRDSVKSTRTAKNKPTITRVPSPAVKPTSQTWVDYEEDLDPVSKPSFFRHIGRIVGTGPGAAYTVELHKPPQGKLGLYIAQGFDETKQKKSVFITRFYQQNAEKFYGGLLQPRDELIAVNDRLVRDRPVSEVQQLIGRQDNVRLTILPISCMK